MTLWKNGLRVTINGREPELSATEFGLFAFLAEQCNRPEEAYAKQAAALPSLSDYLQELLTSVQRGSQGFEEITNWHRELESEGASADQKEQSLRRRLSAVRKEFNRIGLHDDAECLLPKKGNFSISIDLRKTR